MTIRFPKMHIATSVVNRIQNAFDGIQAAQAIPSVPNVPQMPDSSLIDQKLNAPVGDVPPIDDPNVMEAANNVAAADALTQ